MALINNYLALLLPLVVLVLCVNSINCNEKSVLKPEDWQPIHYQAYAASGPYLKPKKTLELLKKLEKIYEPYNDVHETNGRKSKVRRLVAASELHPSKCTRDHLADLMELRDFNSPFTRTIVPYIGHALVEYLDLCEDKLLHNLHDGVRDMKPEYQRNIRTLAGVTTELSHHGYAVGKHNLTKIWMHFGHLIGGILAFMKLQLGNKFEKLGDVASTSRSERKLKYMEAFEEHLWGMCQSWIDLTDPIEAFHELDLRLHYSKQELQWISYGHFCHFIERYKDSIKSKSWRQLKRSTSKFGQLRVGTHRKLSRFNFMDPFA